MQVGGEVRQLKIRHTAERIPRFFHIFSCSQSQPTVREVWPEACPGSRPLSSHSPQLRVARHPFCFRSGPWQPSPGRLQSGQSPSQPRCGREAHSISRGARPFIVIHTGVSRCAKCRVDFNYGEKTRLSKGRGESESSH